MLVFVSSDRCIPMTIQYPKQFDLEFKTDVAQFIQKKRAAFRRRQKAALIPAGSCKRPLLISENSLSSSFSDMAAQFTMIREALRWLPAL